MKRDVRIIWSEPFTNEYDLIAQEDALISAVNFCAKQDERIINIERQCIDTSQGFYRFAIYTEKKM